MMHTEFTISLAGIPIGIRPLHPYIHEYCREYLTREEPAFTVGATQEELDTERRRSAEEDLREGMAVRQFSDGYLETLAVYRKIVTQLLQRDILLFHGSCLALDGVAYLFTAKSGTGKSTHSRLWRQQFGSRVVMVNDDKPLLAATDRGAVAYGTPWNGKHRLSTNGGYPLKAICILERSPENHIEQITNKEAYPWLLQQAYRPRDPAAMAKTLQVLDKLLASVSCYRLGCNMDPAAAVVSCRGMNGDD